MTLKLYYIYKCTILYNIDIVYKIQDAQVAQQYKKDRKAFNKQAAEWTKKYAGKGLSVKDQENAIKTLMEMGIKRDRARRELTQHGWDIEAAINACFGN